MKGRGVKLIHPGMRVTGCPWVLQVPQAFLLGTEADNALNLEHSWVNTRCIVNQFARHTKAHLDLAFVLRVL